MAHSLHSNLTLSLSSPFSINLNRTTSGNTSCVLIRCGPRDNRGPLVKGRILSKEAIQAIQSLKRAHRSDPTITHLPSLSRLIKTDLLATLRELLRQEQCTLALHVLSTVRSEYPPVDLDLCGDVVKALGRNRLYDDIDHLINQLGAADFPGGGDKVVLKLVKGLIEARRSESTVRIYDLMKESGWGSATWRADDYLVEVLSRGLRKLGEIDLGDEIQRKFGRALKDNFQSLRV